MSINKKNLVIRCVICYNYRESPLYCCQTCQKPICSECVQTMGGINYFHCPTCRVQSIPFQMNLNVIKERVYFFLICNYVCLKHVENFCRYSCKTCEQILCEDCLIPEHIGHDVTNLDCIKGFEDEENEISSLLSEYNAMIPKLENKKDTMLSLVQSYFDSNIAKSKESIGKEKEILQNYIKKEREKQKEMMNKVRLDNLLSRIEEIEAIPDCIEAVKKILDISENFEKEMAEMEKDVKKAENSEFSFECNCSRIIPEEISFDRTIVAPKDAEVLLSQFKLLKKPWEVEFNMKGEKLQVFVRVYTNIKQKTKFQISFYHPKKKDFKEAIDNGEISVTEPGEGNPKEVKCTVEISPSEFKEKYVENDQFIYKINIRQSSYEILFEKYFEK